MFGLPDYAKSVIGLLVCVAYTHLVLLMKPYRELSNNWLMVGILLIQTISFVCTAILRLHEDVISGIVHDSVDRVAADALMVEYFGFSVSQRAWLVGVLLAANFVLLGIFLLFLVHRILRERFEPVLIMRKPTGGTP
eukprot:1653663-Prymnesium_polylepis.1